LGDVSKTIDSSQELAIMDRVGLVENFSDGRPTISYRKRGPAERKYLRKYILRI
jgi:hypothetical protein